MLNGNGHRGGLAESIGETSEDDIIVGRVNLSASKEEGGRNAVDKGRDQKLVGNLLVEESRKAGSVCAGGTVGLGELSCLLTIALEGKGKTFGSHGFTASDDGALVVGRESNLHSALVGKRCESEVQ